MTVVEIPLNNVTLAEHTSFRKWGLTSNSFLLDVCTSSDKKLKDVNTSHSSCKMKGSSPNGVFNLELGLVLKGSFDEIERGDGGGNHKKSLSRMCEGGIDDGMNLLQKVEGGLR